MHAHDWLVAHPAVALAEYFDVPLVSTIHATEAGRHTGWVSGSISRQVHAAESWLVRESDSLITCSASMSDEITELFGPGLAEIRVIRNGIDAALWPFAPRQPRQGPAQLLYLGRLEYEKGIHDAIAALPRIRRTHPGTTLIIAGEGTQQQWLVEQARKHKVLKATTFAGRLDHTDLVRLLHSADAVVLPSHYEPFGIVALEAAATGTPLVTSNVGGLGEAVINGQTGVSFAPRDVAGLAAAVRVVLDDPAAAQRRAVAARERLTSDFDWHTVAGETAQVYLAAKRREREPQPRRVIVEHALPDRWLVRRPRASAFVRDFAACRRTDTVARAKGLARRFLAFDIGQRGGQLGPLGGRCVPGQLAVLDHLGRRADRDRVVRDVALDHRV